MDNLAKDSSWLYLGSTIPKEKTISRELKLEVELDDALNLIRHLASPYMEETTFAKEFLRRQEMAERYLKRRREKDAKANNREAARVDTPEIRS